MQLAERNYNVETNVPNVVQENEINETASTPTSVTNFTNNHQ